MGIGWWILATILKIAFVLVILLTYAPVLVWAERRQSAMIQDRVGPHQGGFPMPRVVLENIPLAALGARAFGALNLAFAAASLTLMIFGLHDLRVADSFGSAAAGLPTWQFVLSAIAYPFWIVAAFGWDVTTIVLEFLLNLVTDFFGWGRVNLPSATPGIVLLAASVIGIAHLGIGRILPELFHNGRLTAWGLLHPLADAIKMIWKEDFLPPGADRFLYSIAPIIAVIPAFATFAVIPFGPTIHVDYLFERLPAEGSIGGTQIPLQVANLNVGILYIFAIAGTGIIGAAIAGYSSDNKYSLLGGLRAASQMVSYEVTLGLTLVPMFMIYDTLLLDEMVEWQRAHVWGIFVQPLAFLLFFTASMAEYKRVPFDAPEGESEIVAGYFLEYSGMKFGMFMMGEFVEIVVSSALIAVIFFGGWDVPFLTRAGWEAFGYRFDLTGTSFAILSDVANSHLFVTLVQVGAFLLKVAVLCFLSLQVRWTLPRFRYDQTMQLCWKILLPVSLINILVTGLAILAFG
jgi:NADH-quinone oxidoreductase subunit H